MIQTLSRNWWLLALVGVLDAAMAAIYFVMQNTDQPITFQAWRGAVVVLGQLALAIGVCTIAAGLWRSAMGKCWLLVVNGLGLGALGLVTEMGVAGFRISFRTIALLIVLMAISSGILEWITGRAIAGGWILRIGGAASVGFALAFLALGFRWIAVEPGSHSDLLWLGAYFGFSAICMLGLALRLQRLGQRVSLSPAHQP
jgi:hypothetical protein